MSQGGDLYLASVNWLAVFVAPLLGSVIGVGRWRPQDDVQQILSPKNHVFTVEDPAMYAKPWIHERIFKTLKPSKGLPDLIEYSCNDNNTNVPHLVSTKPAAGSH